MMRWSLLLVLVFTSARALALPLDQGSQAADIAAHVLGASTYDAKARGQLKKQIAAIPDAKLRAALGRLWERTERIRVKPTDENYAQFVSACLDVAENEAAGIETRKRMIHGAYGVLSTQARDRMGDLPQRLERVVEQAKRRDPQEAELYYFATYTLDPYSAASSQATVQSLERCLELDPHQERCQDRLPFLRSQAAAARCLPPQIKTEAKLEIVRVDFSEMGERHEKPVATLALDPYLRGLIQVGNDVEGELSVAGVAHLRESLQGSKAAHELFLVSAGGRQPLGAAEAYFAPREIRWAGTSVKTLCR